MTSDLDPASRGPGRVPLVAAGVIALITVVLVIFRDVAMPNNSSLLPIWLALVAAFNLQTLAVLIGRFGGGAGARSFPFAWALVFSATTTLAILVIIFSTRPDAASARPAMGAVAWLLALRVIVMPALITLSLVPWPRGLAERLGRAEGFRTRVLIGLVVALAGSLALVGAVVAGSGAMGGGGLSTGSAPPTTVLAVDKALNVALLAIGVVSVLARRTAPGREAWALVVLAAECGAALMIEVNIDQDTLGWFAAVGLGLMGATVVPVALLVENSLVHRRTRQYAERLAEQNVALTEAQGLREHLVAVVSHDMRSPLAGLLGYLELLEDGSGLGPEEVQRMHSRSRLLTRRLIMLTEDLLASATPTVLQVLPRPVDLRREIDDCVAAFPELTVIVHCPDDLVVVADSLRLQQILANLVRNAQKYGAEPIRIQAGRVEHDVVQISVSDHGEGVPADFVPLLFERYTRGNSHAAQGSGLGLSVARSLAERHGGTLDYEPGSNSFVLRLPAKRQPTRSGLTLAKNGLAAPRRSESV